MTDARTAAPEAGGRGALGFLRETLASLRDRRLLLPAALLTVLLTVSNIVILLNAPVPGEPPILFAVAALVRVAGLLVLVVALLRVLTGSPRAPFLPDGAFWLYAATLVFSMVLGAGLTVSAGDPTDALRRGLVSLAIIVVSAPLAAWFTALAVERPLALYPAPWLRGMRRWLPPLLLWSVLVILPLGHLHGAIGLFLIGGAGDWFWSLALVDGPLSAVLTIFTYALTATAYRSVARG